MRSFSKIILVFFVGFSLFEFHASAATKPVIKAAPVILPPQLILTWDVNNFHPAAYPGKALPATGAPVTVSVEAIRNNKIFDISNATITWYQNEENIGSGRGLQQITATMDDGAVAFIRAEVEIDPDTEALTQSIAIPVVKPSVAIEIPYPNATADTRQPISLRATPYFFNVSSLSDFVFYWQVGDIKKNMGPLNSLSLKIDTPSQYSSKSVPVSSYVQSKKDLTNIIKTDTTLFLK